MFNILSSDFTKIIFLLRGKHFGYIIIVLLFCSHYGHSQEEASLAVFSEINYGIRIPAADFQERFGAHFALGTNFSIYSKKRNVLSFHYQFLFGSRVKEDVLTDLRAPDGSIISNGLVPSYPLLKLRGHEMKLLFGKWVKIPSQHEQGMLLQLGPGYLRHHIEIDEGADPIPQLLGEYSKGYDRLSAGWGVSSVIGYQYISEDRGISFHVNLSAAWFRTKSLRSFNLDTFMQTDDNRQDINFGIQAGWIFPIIY